MDKRNEFVAEARRWVGTPFMHQGRSRHGIDCIGVINKSCERVGFLPENFERIDYGRTPNRPELLEKLARYSGGQLEVPEIPCIIAFIWAKNPGHIGIYLGETFIHACARATVRRVEEVSYRGAWVRVTHSFWALPKGVFNV